MLDPSVILLEFNELSPLMERAPNLEPWIQWITVYTGLGYGEHHLSSSEIRSGAANPAFYQGENDGHYGHMR